MGHFPLPASERSGYKVSTSPPSPRNRIPRLEPAALIASLRATLPTTAPSEAVFRAIADSARTLTGAEGVALALRTAGAVVCRARSGNLAPGIGDHLDASSGISGECLRTSEALRCDDTQTDDRVNPEVCRSLGIRSIAVVPLAGRDSAVGILEAFSPRAHAFGGEQITLLKQLAEIAQAAYEAECAPKPPAPALQYEKPSRSPIRPELFATSAVATMPSASATGHEESHRNELVGQDSRSMRRYWIAGAAVLLLLAAAVIWTTWHAPDEDAPSPQQTTQPQKAPDEAAGPTALAVIPLKPPAGQPKTRNDQGRRIWFRPGPIAAKPALQNAAEIESEKGGLPHVDEGAGTVRVVAEDSSHAPKEEPAVPSAAAESPPLTPPGSSNESSAELAPAPTKLPALDLRGSQGISEATLLHKVQPIYPATARSQRMEGSVVLELTIGENGSPRDLKVVSGPPILAGAAIEAVRQWRYRPARLNGNPVAAQKQITVSFTAP
jgi:TonB family protein